MRNYHRFKSGIRLENCEVCGNIENDPAHVGGGANDRQVGGEHYKTPGIPEHWDLVAIFGWDYFQGQITKYLMRWRKKNGIEDLEKARHYLDKYIEVERSKILVKVDSEIDRIRGAKGEG
jgi:Protein of unknwon function (DUF3310)